MRIPPPLRRTRAALGASLALIGLVSGPMPLDAQPTDHGSEANVSPVTGRFSLGLSAASVRFNRAISGPGSVSVAIATMDRGDSMKVPMPFSSWGTASPSWTDSSFRPGRVWNSSGGRRWEAGIMSASRRR